jgi:hypothetical protein
VTDVGVARLARSCPEMRYLCLSGCGHLTDATLSSLSQHCPQLATLEVARCSLFTDVGFQALARVNKIEAKLLQDSCVIYSMQICFNITELSLVETDGFGRMRTYHGCGTELLGCWVPTSRETGMYGIRDIFQT